jgi:tellurite resistance protein TerC
MNMFRFLKHGVSFILFFIGLKMLSGFYTPVAEFFARNSWVSLVVIVATLAISILLSLVISENQQIQELEEELKTKKTKGESENAG